MPDTVIQRILRHSNVGVTQSCYIKTTDPQMDGAMEKFGEEIARKAESRSLIRSLEGTPADKVEVVM